MSGNILKHSFQSKSLKTPFAFVYDFEKMIVETNKQSKPGELRKTQGRIVYYKKEYFSYIGEDSLVVEKMN